MGFALKAENVSIRYITGDFKDIGIKEYLTRKAKNNYHVNEFMAVDGVSFTLEHGDMLGIVGTNGAGKSTLLKAVSGIMEPTKGKITANGEVAALLELGSGFDGDLTVKENAYLRGAMLGYTKEFMDETYDHIIDFAELREFEDRPFKQLSSGMKSRLAFSIASLVKPDVLILDEVLSVGDGAFQEKSAKKMREIISQGATTILVSHSLEQIRNLCNKVLWLDHGKQVAFGDVTEVCDLYERYLNGESELISSLLNSSEQEQQTQLKEQVHSTLSNIKKTTFKPLKLLSSAIIAMFFAFIIFQIGTNLYSSNNQVKDIITIYSENTEKNVVYRGTSVDGTWISPWDNVPDHGNWVFNEEQATYTATDETPLTVEIPQGENRNITFNVGPNEGSVCIEMNGETLHFDLAQDEVVELGLPFTLPEIIKNVNDNENNYIIAIITFIILFIVFYICSENSKETATQNRELWGDVLRIICCFVIVLLHNTCNVFDKFTDGQTQILLVNTFTAFAVPCFYMISGAYLLRKPQDISVTLKKRVPKIVIPTLFWGCIYLLMFGEIEIINFLKLFFQNQESHLWFMYSLFGIYMLLPFISKLYHIISLTQKLYGLLLLLVIPTCIYDLSKLLGVWIPTPSFSVFWPDLGIFLLGGFLWELRNKVRNKPKYLYAILFFIGLSITTLGTIYISNMNDAADKSFISAIGSVGNIIMASSVFCFVLSCEENLQKYTNHIVVNIINKIGTVTMGVYFIHVIFLRTLNYTMNSIIPLYSNTGSLVQMISSAIVYFIISSIVCICASNIKFINKLF